MDIMTSTESLHLTIATGVFALVVAIAFIAQAIYNR